MGTLVVAVKDVGDRGEGCSLAQPVSDGQAQRRPLDGPLTSVSLSTGLPEPFSIFHSHGGSVLKPTSVKRGSLHAKLNGTYQHRLMGAVQWLDIFTLLNPRLHHADKLGPRWQEPLLRSLVSAVSILDKNH